MFRRAALALPLIAFCAVSGAHAADNDLNESLSRLLESHKKVAAAQADSRAADAAVSKAWGGWFPDVKLGSSYGYEAERKGEGVTDTRIHPNDLNITVNQLIWDFGKTNADIDKAQTISRQADTTLAGVRQDLLFEGLSARLNLYRALRTIAFAKQSVDNIRRQTGLEESRVEVGGGLPTDVLQAKSQLAGAEARLVRARGALAAALNRYRAVFGEAPPEPEKLHLIAPPLANLPTTLDDALSQARGRNLQIKAATLSVDLAKQEIERVRGAELSPRLALVGEQKYQDDYAGTIGGKQVSLVKVELSYPLNLGMAGYHSLTSARETALAALTRLDDVRESVDEVARNAWENVQTARDNLSYLGNQAKISAEFLTLARQERLLGRRSLLDVLSGETALFNAQADAASAEVDVSISAFALLKTVGRLSLEAVGN